MSRGSNDLRVTDDPSVDAAYLDLSGAIGPGGVARSVVCDVGVDCGHVTLDFDAAGKLVGLEVVGASPLLPAAMLAQAERHE